MFEKHLSKSDILSKDAGNHSKKPNKNYFTIGTLHNDSEDSNETLSKYIYGNTAVSSEIIQFYLLESS